jgi:GNAT superfamily N-acetyltransferase
VDLAIRPAGRSDQDALLVLAEQLSTSFVVDPDSFERSFAAALEDADTIVLVATDGAGDAILGYVLGSVHPTFFANGPVAWMEELMVDGAARRLGVGRALVDACEAWARGRGAVLAAMATRRAGAFWTSVGYEPSATYHRKLLGG